MHHSLPVHFFFPLLQRPVQSGDEVAEVMLNLTVDYLVSVADAAAKFPASICANAVNSDIGAVKDKPVVQPVTGRSVQPQTGCY